MKHSRSDSDHAPIDGHRAAKREKLETLTLVAPENLSPSVVARRKDDGFWFNDGTITLICGDVEFRVYKGPLVEHSTVFRDMFSLARPETVGHGSLTVDTTPEHPVIRLDDSPHALRHILRACMPVKDRSFFAAQTPSFEAIRACIFLGDKYQLTRLYDEALEFLKGHFTTSFGVWDKLGSWIPTGWEHHEVVGVVNIARFTGEVSMLPTALLACTVLGGSVVRGFTREDGEQETLSTHDLELCFEAKERVMCATLSSKLLVLSPFLSQHRYFRASCRCMQDNRELLAGIAKKIAEMAQSDPFAPFSELFGMQTPDICSSCERVLRKRDEVEREKLWTQLPELLGIDVSGWAPQTHVSRRTVRVDEDSP